MVMKTQLKSILGLISVGMRKSEIVPNRNNPTMSKLTSTEFLTENSEIDIVLTRFQFYCYIINQMVKIII